MTPQTLVLGTRGSPLALAQSRQVARELERLQPGLKVEERIIRTTGDKLQGASLPAIGGKGVFTLEIERALLDKEVHLAVHSLKDLPPDLPAGLCLAAIPPRASASDVCVLNSKLKIQNSKLAALPQKAKVGTSSLRRRAFLLHLRPDLEIAEVRGNIDTRLRKLEDQFDAIILARAGLERLGLFEENVQRPTLNVQRSTFALDEQIFVPAPGQGALAIQSRQDDDATRAILELLEHASTRAEIEAERAVVRSLDAGCSTPLGVRAVASSGILLIRGAVLSPDGTQKIEAETSGATEDAEFLGEELAQMLLNQGAGELLRHE